jgi:hypothetical protein
MALHLRGMCSRTAGRMRTPCPTSHLTRTLRHRGCRHCLLLPTPPPCPPLLAVINRRLHKPSFLTRAIPPPRRQPRLVPRPHPITHRSINRRRRTRLVLVRLFRLDSITLSQRVRRITARTAAIHSSQRMRRTIRTLRTAREWSGGVMRNKVWVVDMDFGLFFPLFILL